MLNKWFNWWWNFIPSINWCFAIKHLGIKKCSTAKETVLPRDVNPFLSILTVPMARSNIHVGIVTCTLGFVQKSLFFIFIIGVLYLRKFISNEYDDFFFRSRLVFLQQQNGLNFSLIIFIRAHKSLLLKTGLCLLRLWLSWLSDFFYEKLK